MLQVSLQHTRVGHNRTIFKPVLHCPAPMLLCPALSCPANPAVPQYTLCHSVSASWIALRHLPPALPLKPVLPSLLFHACLSTTQLCHCYIAKNAPAVPVLQTAKLCSHAAQSSDPYRILTPTEAPLCCFVGTRMLQLTWSFQCCIPDFDHTNPGSPSVGHAMIAVLWLAGWQKGAAVMLACRGTPTEENCLYGL